MVDRIDVHSEISGFILDRPLAMDAPVTKGDLASLFGRLDDLAQIFKSVVSTQHESPKLIEQRELCAMLRHRKRLDKDDRFVTPVDANLITLQELRGRLFDAEPVPGPSEEV